MTNMSETRISHFLNQLRQRRLEAARDAGQTAIIAVLAITLIFSVLGLVLVNTVGQSINLQRGVSVQIYANRALEAGENAYLDAINTNPSLAQCSTALNGTGTCGGLSYGQWNTVEGAEASGADAEYYAFGNPQPTFDPTTHALVSLSVQIVGAAHDSNSDNGYQFNQETITLTPKNGFLDNVWWSNYESYSQTGNYSSCNYNYSLNYNISNENIDCGPVYFAPGDYLFGPVFTNDSVFVGGNGSVSSSPSFGNPSPPSPAAAVPSAVTTADPNCLFVDNDNNTDGMQGGHSTCADASSDVALYDTTNSSYGNPQEPPPTTDASLGLIASQNGCLYSGPTQITLSKGVNGGQMIVSSPDTPVANGQDADNLSQNQNNCPSDGITAAPIPSNGVVFVENATPAQTQTWANPFDGPIENTATNITSNPANPAANANNVQLTATITSASSQIVAGASVTFSHATCKTTSGSPARCTAWNQSTNIGGACSNVSLTPVTPATTPPTATAACTTSESAKVGDTFSASYSGGTYTSASSASVGQSNTYTPTTTYGPDSQVTAGGCSSCYYGETSAPDSEGDAFVNGSLSGELTIGTANNVVIDGNITYADCTNTWTVGQSLESAPSEGLCPYVPGGTNDTLGLIADKYVEVNRPILASSSSNNNPTVLPTCASPAATCDPSDGTDGITIDAAVLALTQSFVVNNYGNSGTEGNLTVYGSIQQFARGPVGTFSGNSLTNGYQKHYTWDPLLDFVSPPSYLAPTTASWALGSVAANPNTGTVTVCPPLLAPYGQSGTITQYCSSNPGGLPGFPSSTAPSPPTNVSASQASGIVTVTWADPGSSGNSPITNYMVSPSRPCSTCTGMTVSGATATSATITGLPAGSPYTFTVTATNADGISNPSIASNPVIIPSAPSAPTGVTATVNGNGSVSVGWTAADGGSAITSSRVTASPACSGCSGTTVSGNGSTATITGLTPGTTYTFTVTNTNALGTSPPSAPSNPILAPSKPGAPIIGTATPGNTTATVNWTAPGNTGGIPITGYVVTPYKAGVAQTAQTFNSTATTETVTGLTNLSSYTFTVAAINGIGTGPASAQSNAVTPAAPPGAPTIGTATAGINSATVTWTAPASNGGAAILGYVVTPYIGGTAQTAQTFNSTTTTETVTGLTANTTYTFKVAAFNVIGTGNQSAASNSITTPKTVAGAPTIGTATSGNASVSLNWTAPTVTGGAAITGYVVTPYIAGVAQATQTFNSTATTETVTGLTNGTAYTFTVAAINSVGTGAASAQSNAVTPATVPGAPTIGTATFGNASATVTWTAPASNGGSAITGYVVTPYKAGVAQTAQTFNSTATTETVTGLTNGSSYTFKVAAINSVGTGAQSAASNAVTPATVPGAPTITTAVAANTSVAVTWTAPASNGGSAITGYVVTPSIAGVAQAAQTFNSTATTETATGLTNGTAYTFTVAAINGVGTGAQSAASNPATPATKPGVPTIGTATAGPGSATVTWTAPASNGGAAITGYVVTPYKAGVAQTAQTFNSAATTETATGLANNTAYTFTVAAINVMGTGAASAQSNSVTTPTTPGAPTIGTATAGVGSATVTWTAPVSNGGSAITGYVVTPYKAGVAQTAQTFNSTATTETATALANNTAYTFTVAAINGVGTGAASAQSNSVTTPTTPGAPTIGTATRGNASATVTWTAPASNGGSAITGYVVTPSSGTAQTFNSTATTETVTGLTNGTAYTFKVAAINGVGTGAQSAASNSVTPATTAGAPTIGTATFGNASASVTWTAPGSNGGSAVTGYVVTPYIAGVAQATQTFNSTATTETATGLTNGTAYTFTVAAINGVGTGAQSAASNAVTPATTPGTPTIGTATAGVGSASVTWTAPVSNGGSAITGYVVTPYKAGVAQATQTFNSTATTETATGLANNTAYTFTVAAINGVGTGSASAQSNAVTTPNTPGAPTIGTATFGNASATVTWTAPASNGGSAITGYVVTPYKAGVAQATQTFNSTATTETATGLTNGSSYTFTVAAINGVGTGAASAQSNAVTPATTAGAPTGLSGTSGNASVSLSWTAPGSNGGSAITGYVVTPYKAGVAQATQTFNSTATTETATGLTNGTAYTFTVAAINGVGTGAQSAASAAVTPATTPGAPTIGTATFGNASASVTWTAPASNGGSAITGYVVTPYKAGVAQTAQTFNSTATTETATGLTNGTSLHLHRGRHQRRRNRGGLRPVQRGDPGHRSWSPDDHGRNARQHLGRGHLDGSGLQRRLGHHRLRGHPLHRRRRPGRPDLQLDGHHRDGHRPDQRHRLHLHRGRHQRRRHRAGLGRVPLGHPGHRCRARPPSATATAGDGSATVTWTAPASNGGSADHRLHGHPLHRRRGPGHPDFASTATTETVTGLTNGTAYTFTVAATNGVGTGTASAQSNAVTPATTPGAPTIGDRPPPATPRPPSPGRLPPPTAVGPITGYIVTPYIGRRGPGHPDLQLDRHHRDGHRPDQRHRLHLHRGRHQRRRHRAGLGRLQRGDPGHHAGGPHRRCPAPPANASVSRHLDGAGLQRRVGRSPATWSPPTSAGVAQATPDLQLDGHHRDGHRPDQRHRLHLHRGGHQRRRAPGRRRRRPPRSPRPPCRARPPAVVGTAGNASVSRQLDRSGLERRSAITGYTVTPYIAGVAQAAQTFNSHGHHRDDHRPDRRHRLHLHRGRHQRRRHRGGRRRRPPRSPRPPHRGRPPACRAPRSPTARSASPGRLPPPTAARPSPATWSRRTRQAWPRRRPRSTRRPSQKQ